MTSVKQQRKKLKGPDQFQVAATSYLSWFVTNARVLALGAIPVVVVVAGLAVWNSMQRSQATDRREELGGIQVQFDAELKRAEESREGLQKRIDEIEQKLADAKKANPAAPPDAALTEEKKKLEAERDAIKPDHKASLAAYEAFFKKHDGKAEGWMAGMSAARMHLDEERLEPAREILETILARAKGEDFYQIHARMMLIGVLEDLGDLDKALEHANELEKRVDEDLKPRVLLVKGRLLVMKKAGDEAKATFKTLIEEHGASPEAQKARSLQALLN